MSRYRINILIACLSLLFTASFWGCSQSNNQPAPSMSELQKYVQENPDKLAAPEDSTGGDAAEFAAGASDGA